MRGVYAPMGSGSRVRSRGLTGPAVARVDRVQVRGCECEPRFHRRRSTGRADGLRPPSCCAWTVIRSRELDWPSNVTRPRKASAVLLRPSGKGRIGRYLGFSPNETMNLCGNLFHCRLAAAGSYDILLVSGSSLLEQ